MVHLTCSTYWTSFSLPTKNASGSLCRWRKLSDPFRRWTIWVFVLILVVWGLDCRLRKFCAYWKSPKHWCILENVKKRSTRCAKPYVICFAYCCSCSFICLLLVSSRFLPVLWMFMSLWIATLDWSYACGHIVSSDGTVFSFLSISM